ncbi:hypothetical protein K0040_00235 [Terrisporobacter petrolearius]|uniref:glycosyltransferase n=1 Tax=Terrisporobacter petrolearius TaxID=1460447 RepID=UPI001D15E683|nr:glycosyltransferase [Terrisporobacter petrolearius]MCC3862736.1 hypothetical protein [Terrisporobacter petrolearius]
MKGLYIARIDEEYSLDLGVGKKIRGQIHAFNQLGYDIDYLRLSNKTVKFNETLFNKVKYRFFGCRHFYKVIKNLETKHIDKYDFIYIRYIQGNISLYNIIKYFSKRNKKIIVEIPTYPYNTEFNKMTLRRFIVGNLDKYITKQLCKYVFRISVTNTHSEIFGIKTININNGIDLRELPIVDKKEESKINMIGIANLARWHGYDRVIKGLANYYNSESMNKKDVNFYIVGEGSEKNNLMTITKELRIEDKVHFLGAKAGQELNNVFNWMHIGVSSLALFRAGGGHDPIKSKEFLGRGIPVLLGYEDKLIDMKLPYVLKVDESDTPINIEDIVKKYESCSYIENNEIRKYSEEFLTWKFQMNKIIKELKLN